MYVDLKIDFTVIIKCISFQSTVRLKGQKALILHKVQSGNRFKCEMEVCIDFFMLDVQDFSGPHEKII